MDFQLPTPHCTPPGPTPVNIPAQDRGRAMTHLVAASDEHLRLLHRPLLPWLLLRFVRGGHRPRSRRARLAGVRALVGRYPTHLAALELVARVG